VDRLSQLTDLLDSPRADVALAHASALAAADGDTLDAVSRGWEMLGDLVAAGDAAAHAAATHRDQGRHGSAVAAAATAHRLAQASGARTPALAMAATPLPLTAREREIAVLAARGLSNRMIAERLLVSVRTVEGHVYRAGHKLGMSDRAGFAAFVKPEPFRTPRR
jgi:DNA-binding NarL/FixJ family response regulator